MNEAETLQPLMLDLVEWCASSRRSYTEAMEAWRTSCPRLPVWETALDAGYLRREWHSDSGAVVAVTESGERFLYMNARGAAALVASVG